MIPSVIDGLEITSPWGKILVLSYLCNSRIEKELICCRSFKRKQWKLLKMLNSSFVEALGRCNKNYNLSTWISNMTSPVEEWHKIHMTHEMDWNLQNWQASKSNCKIWNWHEKPCSSEILQDLISDLRLLDSFISYQKGGIWWSFQRDDEWYKGSSTDTM